ncbi:hypothetical protein BHM03_00000348, partial [Ensete ventricosum]
PAKDREEAEIDSIRPPMASQGDRESFVYIARLAEQAERYDGTDRIPPSHFHVSKP